MRGVRVTTVWEFDDGTFYVGHRDLTVDGARSAEDAHHRVFRGDRDGALDVVMRVLGGRGGDRLTRAELREMIDRAARRDLGITGFQFLSRLRDGGLDELEPRVGRLAVLARLLDQSEGGL